MAIKISGSTIIDDGRSLVNVGVSTISGDLHVGTGVTVFSSTGIVSATAYHHSDGTFLGFRQDVQDNLYAGTCAGAASDADTGCNIALGRCAGASLNEGDRNILLGCQSGCGLTNGKYNIYIGASAGGATTGGCGNIGIGNLAGRCMGSGAALHGKNIMIGECSTRQARCGERNVLIGEQAATYMDYGFYNAYFGSESGMGCSTVACNVPLYNSFFGYQSGKCTSAGKCNTFLGAQSGNTNTTGCLNVAIGYDVELPNATDNYQFAIGALTNRWIVGNNNFNVGIGTTNPDPAVGVGNTAKLSVGIVSAYQLYGDGSNLSGVGFNPDAKNNLFAGCYAGSSIESGACRNVGLGLSAGSCLTTGDENVFIGDMAGFLNCTGSGNVLIGDCTGTCASQIYEETYIGSNAGK